MSHDLALGDAHAVVTSGGRHHVFFHHRAAKIVCTVKQANLTDLEAQRRPGDLNVVNVVQGKARHRQVPQVFMGGCAWGLAVKARVLCLQGPHRKAVKRVVVPFQCPILLVAQLDQMPCALLEGFAKTDHHGGNRVQPQALRHVQNPKPVRRWNPCGRGLVPHVILEDFTTRAGKPIQTRVFHLRDDFEGREAKEFLETQNFFGAEGIQSDGRVAFFQETQQVQVPVKANRRIDPALKQNARPTNRLEFRDFLADLLEAERVRIRLAWRAVKRAEVTPHIADVGVIDVAINQVRHHVRIGAFQPDLMRGSRQVRQWQVVQPNNFWQRQPLAGNGFLEDIAWGVHVRSVRLWHGTIAGLGSNASPPFCSNLLTDGISRFPRVRHRTSRGRCHQPMQRQLEINTVQNA